MRKFRGHKFIVMIDRSASEKGYVIRTIDDKGETIEEINKRPMKYLEFVERFGFSPEWPHENKKI